MKELYEKIMVIQQEAKPIVKDSFNPYHKSQYFNINALLREILPLFHKSGLLLMQPVEKSVHGDQTENNLHTIIIDMATQQRLDFYVKIPQLEDIQKLGASITYLRRYSLTTLLAIQGEEDDDGNKASGKETQKDEGQKAMPQAKPKAPPAAKPPAPTPKEQKPEPKTTPEPENHRTPEDEDRDEGREPEPETPKTPSTDPNRVCTQDELTKLADILYKGIGDEKDAKEKKNKRRLALQTFLTSKGWTLQGIPANEYEVIKAFCFAEASKK